ncbi:SMC N domain containing protein [Trichuris trichiura]|uniref:Structural maintenance of chromosomes protein 5 n=1 Tax=Trichuris trichiura TaxID=36087 RepID=A0A077Z858_TRITR|nr:SMC N domain containing protein [Trichuris trichiura]
MLPNGVVTPKLFYRTHDFVEVMPDPHLNLVIGPNGSGKSSLMCALCLVFAGSLKALGRQSRFDEFIKWGQDHAEVEVEIIAQPYCISWIIRIVQMQRYISIFVQSFARGYNIQVDNLCQFLAQDNVVQFSRQSPLGLLKNTTEAVSCSHRSVTKCALCFFKRFHGFTNVISNMFDAPSGVKSYLCTLHNVSRICVGTMKTEKSLSAVVPFMCQRGLSVFFTPNLKVATSTSNLLTAKKQWISEAKKLAESISKRFGVLMRQLGYDGEVRLDVPNDEEAPIDHCGLRIMVQFGSGGVFRELNDHHQSGGERSVSIILYMFALQQLSVVPFRCVDEINQGMDPENERKVFDLMVKMLSGSNYDSQLGGTQYIMFTPKLLPNCNFGEETKLWCMLNGIGATSQKVLTDALKEALDDSSYDQMECA